jgi:2-polyprenyl-6-methoxyphenol hydroxylase-like FAD-dependent oxidoreductase
MRVLLDTDVIIVGADPAGLMLAGELWLAGLRPLVLERQPGVLLLQTEALSRWFGTPVTRVQAPGRARWSRAA